jgi:hypothetical protein
MICSFPARREIGREFFKNRPRIGVSRRLFCNPYGDLKQIPCLGATREAWRRTQGDVEAAAEGFGSRAGKARLPDFDSVVVAAFPSVFARAFDAPSQNARNAAPGFLLNETRAASDEPLHAEHASR